MKKVPENLIPYLKEMLWDLEANKLVVEKTEGDPEHPRAEERIRNGCEILAVSGRPPEWYSILCRMHPRQIDKYNRHPWRRRPERQKTKLKRRNILNVLKVIVKKGKTGSEHADYLFEVAEMYKEAYDNLQKTNEALQSVIVEEEIPY